ncbi:hypothetical protein B5P46_14385 [Rhizobium leguminosarum]|uniref:Putative Flp pilus-assembly TadG-like N-terminal domain-containing protein n=2 Tax=Rhizobium TaxID=379 RepID=A0A4V1P1U9_RHILE|nr:pilus assembly protein TadG-related protein [Rhizobium leguminosarum]RXT25280.1 hypothetical protein B5P46_14385 [Rhizobium leguminosarum]
MTPTLIKRLHRDERGFLSPIILYMTIALALMIVWILNTGQMIYDKQRTQDTADAAALVHADWEARYLNIMAMNNVASSQATVILATSVAYEVTMIDLGFRSTWIVGQLTRYMGTGHGPLHWRLPTGAPYCASWPVEVPIPLIGQILQAACTAFQVVRMKGALEAGIYIYNAHEKYDPPGLISKSNDIIKAMNALNDYLVESFPDRVGKEALNLVHMNRADHVVFHPPCTTCDQAEEAAGGDLPVERGALAAGSAYAEMCLAMSKGTQSFGPGLLVRGEFANRGFAEGTGPLTAGGGDGGHIRDFVNHESGIDDALVNFYIFYEAFGPAYFTRVPFKAIIEQNAGDLGFFAELLIDVAVEAVDELLGIDLGVTNPFQLPIDEPPRYSDAQTKDENAFTRYFDDIWDQVCGVTGGALSVSGISPVSLPRPYWLKGRTIGNYTPFAPGDQMTDYRSLAIVSRSPRARLQRAIFRDRTASAYAMAQSWVHNYTAFDLYTQDWLASLAPATLADNIDQVSNTIKQSPAADSFTGLTRVFDQGGANAWAAVNTH